MIGAKTLATIALFTAALVAALALGVLSPDRLVARGAGTLFLAGLFGLVVGTLAFHFGHLGDQSRHYFRWSSDSTPWETNEGTFLGGDGRRITIGDNRGEAFDLPPRAQHALAVGVCLLVALGCMDARTVDRLARFRQRVGTPGATWCPDPDAPPPPVDDPNVPGCELMRRAYALGYVKNLGECAPKQLRSEAAAAPCLRRQRDEPMFHFAWRLLHGFWDKARQASSAAYLGRARHDFDQRLGRLGSLRSVERQVLASAPHAAHHLFTNLPDPGDGAFSAVSCNDRYRWLPHRPTPAPGPRRASLVFEHVLAQLLFESRYEPAAGYCREYHVHWGAPADACARLVADPERFLAAAGALDSVRAVLERRRVAGELTALRGQPPPVAPERAISFSCYVEGEGREESSQAFTLAGEQFRADALRVPPSPSDAALFVDRYDAVARLLVKGFHYGRLLSEAGLGEGASPALAASFAGRDFVLSRLYELDSIDLYVDPGFLATRPDLLEVYPYQRHLKNYVQTFRRQYLQTRGRL